MHVCLRTALPQRTLLAVVACFGVLACNPKNDGKKPSGATCPKTSTVSYESFVAPFMTKYCNDCHGSKVEGADREGAPLDHNFDSLEGVLADPSHIDEEAASGPNGTNDTMPPSGDKPTREEREKLGEWIACQVAAGEGDEHEHDEGEEHERADAGE